MDKSFKALNILRFTNKEAASRWKTPRSAIIRKRNRERYQAENLFIKTVMVDGATQLKRISAAPQDELTVSANVRTTLLWFLKLTNA